MPPESLVQGIPKEAAGRNGMSAAHLGEQAMKKALAAAAIVAALVMTTAATAARSPHEPTYRPVPADVKAAKSLLLRADDLAAGFRAVPVPSTAFRCTAYDPDLSNLVTTGEALGRYLERRTARGYESVATMAYVFRSTREANAYWRSGFDDKRNGLCIVEILKSSVGKATALLGQKLEWIRGTPKIERFGMRGQRAVIWSVAPILSVAGQRFSVEISVWGFISGRTAVFAVIGAGGDSFRGTLVEKILVTLTDRLQAVTPSRARPLSAG
jgi:hypothetical protein